MTKNRKIRKDYLDCKHENIEAGMCMDCGSWYESDDIKELPSTPEPSEEWVDEFETLLFDILLKAKVPVEGYPIGQLKKRGTNFISTLLAQREKEVREDLGSLIDNNRDEMTGTLDYDGIAADLIDYLSTLSEAGEKSLATKLGGKHTQETKAKISATIKRKWKERKSNS